MRCKEWSSKDKELIHRWLRCPSQGSVLMHANFTEQQPHSLVVETVAIPSYSIASTTHGHLPVSNHSTLGLQNGARPTEQLQKTGPSHL